jgi:acetyltransferase-like isoleucine patch superfamily enzyme
VPGAVADAVVLAPLRWLVAAYLTLRFVDEWRRFPAIVLRRRSRLRIRKAGRARLAIPGRLVVESYMGQRTPAILVLGPRSTLTIAGPLTLGDDVRIRLEPGAAMRFGGARREGASGITARSVVLAHERLEVGEDALVSWDTFLTDSDGHSVGGRPFTTPTTIGDHVWIGAGAKVLRGARIGDGSIVAAGAVVLAGDYPARSVLAGVPATIVKKEVAEWRR